MLQSLPNEQLIKSFLLRELPENEDIAVQERLFTDEQFFEELEVIKGEMTEDYVFGLLSAREQQKVETHFLTTPESRQKLKIAETLGRYAFNAGATGTSSASEGYAAGTRPVRVHLSFISRIISRIPPGLRLRLKPPAGEGVAGTQPDVAWNHLLAEAHSNRDILSALTEGDWMGLKLVAHLRSSSPATEAKLAAKVGVDQADVDPVMIRLVQSGLVEKRHRDFSCTKLGADMLRRFEETLGVTFHP